MNGDDEWITHGFLISITINKSITPANHHGFFTECGSLGAME
jgi:hypothetical protein